MKKLSILVFILNVSLFYVNAQDAASLIVHDTRYMNDSPNFITQKIRADFKLLKTLGLSDNIFDYSTNISITPWVDETGGFTHQLNFNNKGIYYRTGGFQSSVWNNWKKIVTSNLNGNIEGSIGILGNLDLWTITSDEIHIGLSNKGIRGGDHLWRLYTASYPGGWGLAPNSFEIWEYPELSTATSNTPALRRFAIQTNRDKDTYSPIIIGSKGSLNIGYEAGFVSADSNDLSVNGNVGIGTLDTQGYKLAVNGIIRAKEIKVESGWADFVFKKDYRLPTLDEVKAHIDEKGTLPGVPSESEVKANGISLGESNALLLQKIEELTLYMIKLQNEVSELKSQIKK